MKKITFLVISLMISASANGQSTTNSIYIDQVGDGSEITLTQEGDSNTIGEADPKQFVLQGDNQTVDITQKGDTNIITGSIENADSINYVTSIEGTDNKLEYNQGAGASTSVEGSKKKLTVDGDDNTLKFNQGTSVAAEADVVASATTGFSPGASGSLAASAQFADQVITVTGDNNKYTSTINTDYVKNTVKVDGGTNVIKIVQDGYAGTSPTTGKSVEMELLGSGNKISVNQKSIDNVDKIEIKSDSSNSILVINQCNTPGPC